jgi:hypothetical protein
VLAGLSKVTVSLLQQNKLRGVFRLGSLKTFAKSSNSNTMRLADLSHTERQQYRCVEAKHKLMIEMGILLAGGAGVTFMVRKRSWCPAPSVKPYLSWWNLNKFDAALSPTLMGLEGRLAGAKSNSGPSIRTATFWLPAAVLPGIFERSLASPYQRWIL